jgi:tRNA A-37 threonylcarbamoyl transferase component Bud32/KaiC/GvpD/RAD55 family RecA-like ATPase/tetratricopeptide (TPR) repeat protein
VLGLRAPRITISRVELLEELGRGAHSVVYRARREGRFYAVKLPLHGEKGVKARFLSERFRREAVALARVRHPALPAVMEVGQVERVPYIIMELAAGQTLAERLRYQPLNEPQVIELGRKLADALATIHRNGLVHRDVKPKNILFDPQTAAVRLVDFGFAASADARSLTDSMAGTPAYMAPEQLAGIRERVDGRADLFALGCVLFEAITGSAAFLDEDPASVIRQYARPLDAATGTPGVSKPLADIIARLLARHPDDRYVGAEALLDDLAQLDDPDSRPAARRVRRVESPLSRAGPMLPLVGRQHEIERLCAAWIDAQGGRGQIVVVRGGAGSGKTRLVQALLDDVARSDRTALIATCQAAEPQSFSAVRQLVEAYVRILERASGGERVKAIARLRTLAGDVAPLLRVLSRDLAHVFEAAPPLPRFEDAEHVFAEAVTEFLFKLLTEIEPAFLFVDNVHWLDAGSRRVLARLSDRIAATSVLVVFATRTGNAASDKLLTALPRNATTELELGSLDEVHAMQVVRAYLGPFKVDAEALQAITNLTDCSPLATLELVRAMLDAGVLVPWWGTWKLDHVALGQMALPREAGEILTRRVRELDAMTRMTLQAAAVVGMEFEDDVLPFAAELEEGHVHSALFEARRALLVEAGPRGTHCFVHDSVREALLDMLSQEQRGAVHQRIAEGLDARGPAPAESFAAELAIWRPTLENDLAPPGDIPDLAFQYVLATHYSAGDVTKNPQRVFETNLEAGRLAFRGFDNDRALVFFESARRAAAILGIAFDAETNLLVAEAGLRTGRFEQSLGMFQSVVEQTTDNELQARAFSRIAWIQMHLNAEAAWSGVAAAFRKLGEPAPSDSFLGLISAVCSWIWHSLLPRRAPRDVRERRRLVTLATLYYLTARLAFHTAKPMPLIQSTLRCLHPAHRLGPSDALARGYVMLSFVLTALGWRSAGRRYLERAWSIARTTQDPVVQANVLQVKCTISAWAGDVRGALEAGTRALEDFGHWRELAEFCSIAANQALLENVRGRNRDAWRWLEVAIHKVNQHEGPPFPLDYLELAARATLTSLGREREADVILGRLKDAVRRAGQNSAIVVYTQGAEVRPFTEAGRLGPELEEFIAGVKKAGHNPRRVHMAMTEYYVQIAHARVHACLRAEESERERLVNPLREAARDLSLAARIPLLNAHARVINGYVAFFSGKLQRAERLLTEAQRLGEQEGAPWVLYAVCRARAHMLREQGRDDDAHDQARLAEELARAHGATYRVRWIREEFGMRGAREGGLSSSSSSSPTASRGALRSRGNLHAAPRIA